jgi:hypothetical protein
VGIPRARRRAKRSAAYAAGPSDPFDKLTTDEELMSLYATYTPG